MLDVFGLTGNMGCGKSTVGEFLKRHNDIRLLDCDKISKDLLFDTANKENIEMILGSDITKNGVIDIKMVSQIIFNDPVKKQSLENFIHPLVWKSIKEQVQNGDENTIFVVESALIYETKQDKNFKGIIVATCETEEQYCRIKKRNNLSNEQIEERLIHQLPNSFKEESGLVVINTSCSLEELELKVEKLYSFIKKNENSKLLL